MERLTQFFESAFQPQNKASYYVVGILVALIGGQFIGSIPFIAIALPKAVEAGVDMEQWSSNPDFSEIGMSPLVGLVLFLLPFVVSMLLLYLVVKYLHRMPFRTLISGNRPIRWNRIWTAFGLWFMASAILEVISYYQEPELYVWQFDASQWVPLVLISLTLLPIQTSFEEMMFRGYGMQGLGLLFRNRWLPLVITSLAFGLMHMANPEVSEFGTMRMMTYYTATGLFLGLITIMDDGLELALGVHAATNIYGATIVSFDGSVLQTPTIWRVTEINVELMVLGSLVIYTIWTLLFAWLFKWKDWERIWRPITIQPPTIVDAQPLSNE